MFLPAIAFAIVPGLGAYGAFREIKLVSTLVREGIECPGIIVSQRKVTPGRGASYFVPRVRFKTVMGEVIEGESAGADWLFSTRGGIFSNKVEFFDNSDAYVRYTVHNPNCFLFIQELNQTGNYWLLAATTLMMLGMLLSGLFGSTPA